MNQWVGYGGFYLASELGYLDRKKVKLASATSTSEVIAAIKNNTIGAAAVTIDEAILIASAGTPISIVLVVDFSNGGDAVLAREAITDLSQLKNKRIGYEKNAVGATMMFSFLKAAGLKPSEVVKIHLETMEHFTALSDGKVDALVTFEPMLSKNLSQGHHVIFDSSEVPGFIVDVLVVREDLVTSHREEIGHLVEAYFRALEFQGIDPDKASDISHSRLNLSRNEYIQAKNGIEILDVDQNKEYLSPSNPVLIESLRDHGRILVEEELLENFEQALGIKVHDDFVSGLP